MNAISNHGGPMDILPPSSNSIISGASVPSRTSVAATTSNTLLSSRNVSRDSSENPASESSDGARQA